MVTTATGLFPYRVQPLNSITPFTYRDGTTYAQLLEELRVYLNDTLRPEFNTEMDRIIDDFQAGITNAETRIIATETEYDGLIADARAYVDASVQFINNKTGQAQIQRVTLTGPYTVTVDPLWPNNHPINIVLTQDGTGGHAVTWDDADINGTVPVSTAANAETDFWLVPEGDGSWTAVQYVTDAKLTTEIATINTALGTKANASSVTASLALKADQTALDATNTTVGTKADKATSVTSATPVTAILGAIRNTGTGWELINDATHQPVGIGSVTTSATGITVNYAAGVSATEVGTFLAAPDEALASNGFFCGASVGLTSSVIQLSQSGKTYSDYVWYDGTNWQQRDGIFTTVTFANSVLTVTHPDIVDAGVFNVILTGRGAGAANYRPVVANIEGVGAGALNIEFVNAAGTRVTAPDVNMKVFITHGGGTRTVDPTTIDTTKYPSSNIWIMGFMRQ